MVLRKIMVIRDGIAQIGSRARDDKCQRSCGVCIDRDRVTGRSRHATAFRVDGRRMLDSPRIHGWRRTPDTKPWVVSIPGDVDSLGRAPLDAILAILYPDTVRKPSGPQIGFDGPLKTQRSRAIRRVLQKILDDETGPAIRTELKAFD